MSNRLALCTVSGGFDSTAALLWSLERYPTQGVFVDYGQRYLDQENRARKYVVLHPLVNKHPNWKGCSVVHVDMGLVERGNPWVPYRNLVIASLMANLAVAEGAWLIVMGSKSLAYRPNDPVSFLDSTHAFYKAVGDLVRNYTEEHHQPAPSFMCPLMGQTKLEVLQTLHTAGLDLNRLWNCYREDSNDEPCGECEHCKATQPLIRQVQDADASGRSTERISNRV